MPDLRHGGVLVLRSTLFATVALASYAVALSPGGSLPPPGEEIIDYLDPVAVGEGTRRKSLPPGEASIMARVLVGEAAGQSDAEVRAIAGVIFNRAARASDGLLGALLKNRGNTWAFTCLDPVRANGTNVWGRGVTRSKEFKRMLRLIEIEWQNGANRSFTHYWHPGAMKPAGSAPRWASGHAATRIGDAMFLTLNDGG